MDALGIDQVCLFPTPMLTLGLTPRPDVENALARAYNRWLVENVLAHEPRITSTLYLPLNDPEASYKMVKDFTGKKGVIGFTIVSPRYKAVYDNSYMKTYAAIEEAGLPLVFHGAYAWGGDQSLQLCNRFMAVHALGFSWFNILHCTNWLVNGMPERFPKLKVAWIESGLAWVPFLMQRLDNEWMMRSSEVPLLKRRPSDYMREMFYDQRRDAAHVRVRLPALGYGLAVDDLRSAVPERGGQAQHPRRQRQALLQPRSGDLAGEGATPRRTERRGVISLYRHCER
jgi:hypothetical protein